MTNPADVAGMIARIRAAIGESRERVERWNEQMLAAVDVIRTAAKNDHGVILSVSHIDNVIEAVEHDTVPAGSAYVFDRDRTSGRATQVQFTDWIFDDSSIETVASGYDPVRAFRLRVQAPHVTTPNAGVIITPPSEA